MKIKYSKPITSQNAPQILKAVRKEQASCRRAKLISKIINPVCAVIYTVFITLAGVQHFKMTANKDMLAAASKLEIYRKLCAFTEEKLPVIKGLEGLPLRDLCFIYCAVLVLLSALAITLVIKLVYHPKAADSDEELTEAELAKTLHAETKEMSAEDNSRYSDKWCNYSTAALFVIIMFFFLKFLSVYDNKPDGFIGICLWLFYALLLDGFGFVGAHFLDIFIVWICGLSNKYGTSRILQDTYEYWCRVDPDENARCWSSTKGIDMENLCRLSDYKNEGFFYAMKVISGTHKLSMLQNLADRNTLSFEEFTSIYNNISPKLVEAKLNELAQLGLIRLDGTAYRLTDNGKALMENIDSLSAWGAKQQDIRSEEASVIQD